MKHFRILLPLLVLAMVLSGCGSKSPEPYTFNVNDRTIHIYPESGTIVDGLDVYTYTRTENANGDIHYKIIYPNGGHFNWYKTKNGGYGGGDGVNENLYLSGNTLVWALEAGEPEKKVGSPILGLLLMALGAWHILSPESVFYLSRGWMFRSSEPSVFYLTMARVSGGVLAVLGLVACLI